MLKPVLMSSAALAATVMLAQPAAAFDCAKASSEVERNICADPAAKAADDAMSQAYEALLPQMEGDQAEMLKANQIAWLKLRESNCSWQEKPAEKTACLIEITARRTTYLAAEPASGPGFGDSPKLVPYLFSRSFAPTKCSADVAVFRFAGTAASTAEKTFNGWINDLSTSLENDYGGFAEGDLPEGMQCEYAASASITYASPDLVAMNVWIYMFGGGAHGNSSAASITLDRKSGKALGFGDVFPDAALKPLTALCTEGIRVEKAKRFAEGTDPAELEKMIADDIANYGEAIEQGVADFGSWHVYEDYAEVYFAPYALGSYAEGEYLCKLPQADLKKAAGAKGWIVP